MRSVLRVAIGAAFVLSGCGEGVGRGLDGGRGTGGGKADDVDDANEALSHAERADVCDLRAERDHREADTTEALRIEQERLACLTDLNDEVIPQVDASLADAGHPGAGFTWKVMQDNREMAAQMCGSLAAASDTPVGSGAELAAARCEATMERNLADLIGRHVDLGGDPLALPGAYRRYRACYNSIDEPSDEDVDQGLSEQIAAFDLLANCIHDADAALTLDMGERIADARGGDPSTHAAAASTHLRDHRARLHVMCEHYAHAGNRFWADPVEVAQQRCTISGLEARGRLIGSLTGLEPDGSTQPDPHPDDPDDPGDPQPDPVPPGVPGQACYPGIAGDWSTCLPVVTFASFPSGYEYASGFGGNPNYRPPIALVDLEAVNLNTKVSASFTLGEIAQLHKGRYAIVQPHAIASLQELRDRVGTLTVNSGYRSPAYNKSVGGASFSRHMYGDGFDVKPTQSTLAQTESACTSIGGKLVKYTSHVHCDFRYDPVDSTFFGPLHAASVYEGPRFDAALEMRDGEWSAPGEGFDEGDPVREWTALDEEGYVIGRHIGETFAPPPETARIRVLVGGVVEAEHTL
jgi:hypothetical protein